MSKLNRKQLQKMILTEFKMIGMTGMQPFGKVGAFSQDMGHVGSHKHGCDACGMSPCGCDEYEDEMPMDNDMDALLPMHTSDATPMMGSSMGNVSREDCCAAVMCLIECCSCEITKAALMECCEDIMSGDYDR